MRNINVRLIVLVVLAAIVLVPVMFTSCKPKVKGTKTGLKTGINYMQPIHWRMTYRYRIREIIPEKKFIAEQPSAFDPNTTSVGPGTYEIWFVGPREGEEVRNSTLVYANPEPTKITRDDQDDVTFYYYNLTPDGKLPKDVSIAMQWDFVTFERYTYRENLIEQDYDKNSEIFTKYTKQQEPIIYNTPMAKEAQAMVVPGNRIRTVLNCYNYIVENFGYDWTQEAWVTYGGMGALINADISWQNKHGVCDEFSNVLCAMLRSIDIPARPVAGWCHPISPIPTEDFEEIKWEAWPMLVGVEKKKALGRAGGHAWAEFYMPEIGWVPLDPTWGLDGADLIYPEFSNKGYMREIPFVDYYFGNMDCFRIPLAKTWNHKLNPAPITPGAEPTEPWYVCYTDRSSGIEDLNYGWEGVRGISSGGG